jgi:hypothetical protein
MKTSEKLSVFETLSAINVNDKVEQKDGLTYLSWAWAWAKVCQIYPNASYKVLPTECDDKLGFMCHTEVTIEDKTLPMWLPVLDSKNKAMLKQMYTYETKFGSKRVEPATQFDINKTIMRCLVKNLAMFGLGIYIYAGEDLPEIEQKSESVKVQAVKEEMTPKHPLWKKAVDHIAKGGSISDVTDKYIVSADNIAILTATK